MTEKSAAVDPPTGLKDTTGQPLERAAHLQDVSTYQTHQGPPTLSIGSSSSDSSDAFIAEWSQLYLGIRTRLQIQVLTERCARIDHERRDPQDLVVLERQPRPSRRSGHRDAQAAKIRATQRDDRKGHTVGQNVGLPLGRADRRTCAKFVASMPDCSGSATRRETIADGRRRARAKNSRRMTSRDAFSRRPLGAYHAASETVTQHWGTHG